METSSHARWRRHFETQSTRPLPAIPTELRGLPFQRELVRSLAIFQLGETGEGRIATQIDHVQLPGVDDDYRVALKLFVKEEGRHARVLAAMVRALGGALIHETWTAAIFVRARRLAGIRLKLLVLLVAEVVSVVCYGLLAAKLPRSASRTALLQIAGDERNHLRFHADFFRRKSAIPPSAARSFTPPSSRWGPPPPSWSSSIIARSFVRSVNRPRAARVGSAVFS